MKTLKLALLSLLLLGSVCHTSDVQAEPLSIAALSNIGNAASFVLLGSLGYFSYSVSTNKSKKHKILALLSATISSAVFLWYLREFMSRDNIFTSRVITMDEFSVMLEKDRINTALQK